MEALSQLATGRTLDELESYYRQYPDLPREVILKHDLLRGGHWFTDAALQLCSAALVKSYRLFSYDLMPMKDMQEKRASKNTRVVHDARRALCAQAGNRPDHPRFKIPLRD